MAVVVTSPPCAFEDYCLDRVDPEMPINLMVGDLQRIEQYPAFGYQAPEGIPAAVKASYDRLVVAGFSRHLIASSVSS